jgi:hypothetical protein
MNWRIPLILGLFVALSAAPTITYGAAACDASHTTCIQIAKKGAPSGGRITCGAWVIKCGGRCNDPSALVNPSCSVRGNT